MKKLILFIMGIVCTVTGAQAQIPMESALHPVHWTYHVEKFEGRLYKLYITAIIQPGWHLYSQHQPENAIAVPTTIKFNNDSSVIFKGKPVEIGKVGRYVNTKLDISANQYAGKVDFVQEVKLLSKEPVRITGDITYQVCMEDECLPPGVTKFSIMLNI
jgi:thiol:disulfide interchange protein DsbD